MKKLLSDPEAIVREAAEVAIGKVAPEESPSATSKPSAEG
jgi:hypothetical protein